MDTLTGLLEKYRQAEQAAAQELGAFSLFGLFERGDTPGRFDILVSAPWLTSDRDGLRRLVPFLPWLEPAEAVIVGSIVPLPADAEFVRDVRRIIRGGDGTADALGHTTLGDVEIMRSYVFAPSRVPARALVEAAA